MLKTIVYLIFLLLSGIILASEPDYKYNHDVNGWLKLHKVPALWQDAFLTCQAEGAVLASPLTTQLASAIALTAGQSDVNCHIYLGVTSLWSERYFVSIEGVPLDDMPVDWSSYGDGRRPQNCLTLNPAGKVQISSCDQYLPYVCYKKYKKNLQLNECGTFDNNYQYKNATGSCYKVHKEKKSWSQAYDTCLAEGAYLVVLNDERERDVVSALFPTTSNNKTMSRTYVGLRQLSRYSNAPWLTVTGDSVGDVFHEWYTGNTNHIYVGPCVSLTNYGTLLKQACEIELKFICEKDPQTSRFERVSEVDHMANVSIRLMQETAK